MKVWKFFTFVVFALCSSVVAHADILGGIGTASGMVDKYAQTAAIVLGILFGIAKAVSTAKAPVVIAQIQAIFDLFAKGFTALGSLFQKICDVLAKAVASDGILGKQ